MLSVAEYRSKVRSLASPLAAELCPIGTGFGRVLAVDLPALLAVPPFSNSAMDGFAVRAEDLRDETTRLEVVGDIAAGASSIPTVGPRQAARIMTGAPMPPGADTVVQVELTDQDPGDVPLPTHVIVQKVSAGKNVRALGEDTRVGELVLRAGTTWTPAAAGAAASVGYGEVLLRRRPKVAIFATGSELMPPGSKLEFGQIPDSNSVMLAGLVQQMGGEVIIARAIPDDVDTFHAELRAAEDADLILTSGAVSAGAFEVVRQALDGQVDFVQVSMQPGKPQACGMLPARGRPQVFLGLPGNPVSVFVSAWAFLRPLLDAFQGVERPWTSRRLPAAEAWNSPPGRTQFIPVVTGADGVRKSHRLGSGSHLIASLHLANALAVVPADVDQVRAGDMLDVYLLR